jgi:hypothetical protein
MTTLNEGHHRNKILRLESDIDELEARIESCRKFILAGQIAVAGGAIVLIVLMALAIAAVLGGIVVAGSNRSTAKEATHELTAAEAERAALIGQLTLRLVHDRR